MMHWKSFYCRVLIGLFFFLFFFSFYFSSTAFSLLIYEDDVIPCWMNEPPQQKLCIPGQYAKNVTTS